MLELVSHMKAVFLMQKLDPSVSGAAIPQEIVSTWNFAARVTWLHCTLNGSPTGYSKVMHV